MVDGGATADKKKVRQPPRGALRVEVAVQVVKERYAKVATNSTVDQKAAKLS